MGRRILLLTGSFLRIGLTCPRNLSPEVIHGVENYKRVIYRLLPPTFYGYRQRVARLKPKATKPKPTTIFQAPI